jgi:hypothetical protein
MSYGTDETYVTANCKPQTANSAVDSGVNRD